MTSINNNVVVTNRTVTLESLARERNVSVEALKKHNNITGDTVPANTAVRIPSAKDLAALGLEANNRVSSGPAPEGSVSAASLKAADDSRSGNQVVGFLRGAWGGLTDLAKGVKDMAVGAVNLTGVRGPAEQAKTMTTLKNVATTVAKDPGAVWEALKEPYVQAWEKGEYGEAFGRGAFDVITTIGTAGWGGAAKTGVQAGAKVASVAAKTAKTANRLDDVVRVADTIGDTGRTARTATASTGATRQLAVSKGLKRTDDAADAVSSSRTSVATSGTNRNPNPGATNGTTSGAKPGATTAAKPGAAALDDAAVRAAMDDPAKIDALANLLQSAGGKSSTIALLRNYAARVRSGGTDLGSISELATARRMAEKSLRAGAERTDDVGRVIRESLAPPRPRPNSASAGATGTTGSRTSGTTSSSSRTSSASTAGTAGARTAEANSAGRTSRAAENAARTGVVAERATTAAQGSLADRLQRAGVGAAIVASVAATRVDGTGEKGGADSGATELFDANNPAHLAALQMLINDGNAPGVAAMLEGVPADVVQQLVSGDVSAADANAVEAEWNASISILAQALAYSGIPLDHPDLPGLLSAAMNPEAAEMVLAALRESEGALPSGSVAGSELSIAPVDPSVLGKLSASQSRVVDAGTAPHEVAPGETLESIARAYDTTPEQLLALNPGLEEAGNIAGLILQVPVGSSDVQADAPARPLPTKGANAYATQAPALEGIRGGSGVMQRGMSGQSVMDVQRMLNAAGASPPLALDGKFGPKTEAALKEFQSKNGVQQTGVLGGPSLRKLDDAPTAVPSTRTQRTDRATLTGSALGTTIGDRAEREARRLGSIGACALGVNNTLTSFGIGGRGHAYEKAEQLSRDSRFREVNLTPGDLSSLPRGAVVVWGRSSAKPFGHVSVTLGNGTEASDHIQAQIRGGRYGTDFGRGPDAQGRQFRVFLPA